MRQKIQKREKTFYSREPVKMKRFFYLLSRYTFIEEYIDILHQEYEKLKKSYGGNVSALYDLSAICFDDFTMKQSRTFTKRDLDNMTENVFNKLKNKQPLKYHKLVCFVLNKSEEYHITDYNNGQIEDVDDLLLKFISYLIDESFYSIDEYFSDLIDCDSLE